MESLLSIERAAAVLGISPWTVRKYVRTGKIRPVRIGRRVLIEPEELRRTVEAGKTTGLNWGANSQ
jgi:excisionase family DNA binding protein